MEYRTVGKTGIRVSEIGLGTWELSGDVWGPKDDKTSLAAIHRALDLGTTFIDTAAGYGRGHAEELVGSIFKEKRSIRDKVVISTKVKPECGVFAPPPDRSISDCFSPKWIVSQCNESLHRLQTDYVDILFLHTWSRSWGHNTEWYEAMIQLKKQGKIRSIGISIPDEGIADANVHIEAGRVDVVQCVYNMLQQEPEYTLFPLASKKGVGVIARSPFSSGALIGNWTSSMSFQPGDWRGSWPQAINPNWLIEHVQMADLVKEVAQSYGLSMPLASLQYILLNDSVSSVIPGSANPEHVAGNIDAVGAPSLPHDFIKAIRQLWSERKIHGTYNGSI